MNERVTATSLGKKWKCLGSFPPGWGPEGGWSEGPGELGPLGGWARGSQGANSSEHLCGPAMNQVLHRVFYIYGEVAILRGGGPLYKTGMMITPTSQGYEDHTSYRKVFIVNTIEKGLEGRKQMLPFPVK